MTDINSQNGLLNKPDQQYEYIYTKSKVMDDSENSNSYNLINDFKLKMLRSTDLTGSNLLAPPEFSSEELILKGSSENDKILKKSVLKGEVSRIEDQYAYITFSIENSENKDFEFEKKFQLKKLKSIDSAYEGAKIKFMVVDKIDGVETRFLKDKSDDKTQSEYDWNFFSILKNKAKKVPSI